jgi:hypothetical protein
VRLADSRVGINEEQISTIRGARTGVTCGRNLASINRDDAGACPFRDLGCRIRRCIIDYDDFVRLGRVRSGSPNRRNSR